LPSSFSRKLELAFESRGQLCVGIDPHEELLLENGFPDTAEGLRGYSLAMLDELSDLVGIVKPQVSFFERFGAEGFAVLQELLSDASKRGFLVIADAKRGDIGTTMQAYSDAWIGKNAPFICDALTVNPYLGVKALLPAVAAASERGKGLFVLAATSNPEAAKLQQSSNQVGTVASLVAGEVAEMNRFSAQTASRFGNVGLVIGATINPSQFGIDLEQVSDTLQTPILAPGFGAQGAKLEEARSIFGKSAGRVIYSISRSALRDGMSSLKANVRSDVISLAKALAE